MKASIIVFSALALAWPVLGLAQNQTGTARAAGTALTLYNDGAAVVSQVRQVALERGKQTLAWPHAPAQLLPASLWLAGEGVVLNAMNLSQQTSASPLALLSSRVGQTVTLLSDDGEKQRQVKLVSVAAGHAVIRSNNRLEWIDVTNDWRVVWPASQVGSSQQPLQLTVTARSAGPHKLALTYQRPDVNWHASYTGRYDAQSGTLRLQSLAVISNNSSTPVHAGQVALVAGQVARTTASRPQPMLMARSMKEAAPTASKTAAGHYRYQLEAGVNLAAGATQLQPLMRMQALDVEREFYIGDLPANTRSHGKIRLHWKNTTGKPLPAGPVRIYGQAPAMLLGEDRIGNTPTGAPITLTLGGAFDITAEKQVLKASHEGDVYRRKVAITISSARDKAAQVTIAQHLPRYAEIVSESTDHQQKSASMARWIVSVPAHGEQTLTYSVRWEQ